MKVKAFNEVGDESEQTKTFRLPFTGFKEFKDILV